MSNQTYMSHKICKEWHICWHIWKSSLTPFTISRLYICSSTIFIFEKISLQKLSFIECKIVVKLPRISAATIRANFWRKDFAQAQKAKSCLFYLGQNFLLYFEMRFPFILRNSPTTCSKNFRLRTGVVDIWHS